MKFEHGDSVRDTYVFEVDGETTLEQIRVMITELTEIFGLPDEDLVAPWSYSIRRTKQQFDETLYLDKAGEWRLVGTDETEPVISFLVMFSDEGMAARFKLAYC